MLNLPAQARRRFGHLSTEALTQLADARALEMESAATTQRAVMGARAWEALLVWVELATRRQV